MSGNPTDQSSSNIGNTPDSRFQLWFSGLRKRGFFKYVGRNVLLIIGIYVLLVAIVFLVGKYLVDFEALFSGLIGSLSDRFVLLLFFGSESFTGMVPVDLFVIWTQKFEHPLPYLALLGVLSYAGGVISYGIGSWISRWPRVKTFTERRLRHYITFVRKWGAAFIVIAALFPFTPFSLVVIAITMLKYPFKLFLLFALTRLVRFVIQGAFFFDLLKIDLWIV
jgi:membrane protein YqaA with SNARE-associated domain